LRSSIHGTGTKDNSDFFLALKDEPRPLTKVYSSGMEIILEEQGFYHETWESVVGKNCVGAC
jgi:hypothetical protein